MLFASAATPRILQFPNQLINDYGNSLHMGINTINHGKYHEILLNECLCCVVRVMGNITLHGKYRLIWKL